MTKKKATRSDDATAKSKQMQEAARSSAGHSKPGSDSAALAGAGRIMDAKTQLELFEKAIAKFRKGDFEGAVGLFEQAASGPNLSMAHTARVHCSICRQRMARDEIALQTPEDYYNYAVTLMNSRQHAKAIAHLERALAANEAADHVHYALALCLGMTGDRQGALRHLKRAIEIDPANRSLALRDPDFLELAKEAPLRDLLHSSGGVT